MYTKSGRSFTVHSPAFFGQNNVVLASLNDVVLLPHIYPLHRSYAACMFSPSFSRSLHFSLSNSLWLTLSEKIKLNNHGLPGQVEARFLISFSFFVSIICLFRSYSISSIISLAIATNRR